jgi:putative PIN family toxin of toxin-antitoxin system
VPRLVVDPSTLLAGVVGRADGTPALILAALLEARFEAIACPRLLDEIARALQSKHFRNKLTEGQAQDILDAISNSTHHQPDPVEPPAVLRDPNDDYLVALARNTHAEAIVSGDRDLLEHEGLHPPAITTQAACQLLQLI